jgi:hypothetical protein
LVLWFLIKQQQKSLQHQHYQSYSNLKIRMKTKSNLTTAGYLKGHVPSITEFVVMDSAYSKIVSCI